MTIYKITERPDPDPEGTTLKKIRGWFKEQDALEPAAVGYAACKREWTRLQRCIDEAWVYLNSIRPKLYKHKGRKSL